MDIDMQRIHVIDSHTGGEPTRMVVSGFPELAGTSLRDQLEDLRTRHDAWRRACVLEPRGSDVLVGALLLPPTTADASAGVIFFNNTGYLGMCGHGTIGVVASLAYLGRITPGQHLLDTPVGTVSTQLHEDGTVSVRNVPSWRYRANVQVEVPGHGTVEGDIAWGGNWFFLVRQSQVPVHFDQIDALSAFAKVIRQALQAAEITGENGGEIDHIELYGQEPDGRQRNFVLCPGGAYDRSPCGTGTSAKVACLAADGLLTPGEVWEQTSIVGSQFRVSYEAEGEQIIPTIRGQAWVCGDSTLLLDESDPFRWGITPC